MKEEWKNIFENSNRYQISNIGRVKSLYNGRKEIIMKQQIIKFSRNYSSYHVMLYNDKKPKTYKVHRLVANAFLENQNNYPCVNHIDSNPLNNNVSNLEWCTHKQNMEHARLNNRMGRVDLNKELLIELHHEKRNSLSEISRILNTTKDIVNENFKRYNIEVLHKRKTTGLKLSLEFLEENLKTKSQRELAKELGCTQSNISHVLKNIKTFNEKRRNYETIANTN